MPWKSKTKKREYAKRYMARPDVSAARKAYNKRWCAKNATRRREAEVKRRLERRASCLVSTARTRAKKKGMEFNLDGYTPALQARIEAGVCELTGLPFDMSPGRKYNSPSLDRIDAKRGYLYDNVRVVLLCVNAALGDWGESVFRKVMSSWIERKLEC